MPTANEMVGRAYRRLNLTAVGETPATDELAEGVIALNAMMFGWKQRGVDVTHVELAGGDSIALGSEWDAAIEYLLAEKLQRAEAMLSPEDAAEARRWWRNLAAAYLVIETSPFDNTIKEVPSQFDRYGLYYGNSA